MNGNATCILTFSAFYVIGRVRDPKMNVIELYVNKYMI